MRGIRRRQVSATLVAGVQRVRIMQASVHAEYPVEKAQAALGLGLMRSSERRSSVVMVRPPGLLLPFHKWSGHWW